MKGTKREWLFRVQVPGLDKNDCVYVVGNIPELGAWNHNQAIQLPQERQNPTSKLFDGNNCGDVLFNDDGQDAASDGLLEEETEGGRIFSRTISLPIDVDVTFRYFIAVVCESNGTKNSAKTLIIRKWETHMTPRLIKKNTTSNLSESIPDPERFGYHNGYCKVERGWLTDETVIQFKLFNSPIKIWKNRLQNRDLFIKMTPVNLVRHNSMEMPQFGGECVDDSLSMDTQDIVEQTPFNITEIAVMNDEEATFKYQEQFGRAYQEDEFVVFNVAVRYPDTIAYLVDFYVYSSRSFPGESPPNHIGFSYILPSTLQSSVGLLTVPITSTKHRPIGQLTVEYITIKPIPDYPWDMSISYAKHWEARWSGLDVGHRGLGTSFKFEMKNCANVRENTIASLKTASHHGADMVEFDVQLSKDMIPVIYHDFHVSISLKRKKQIDAMDMLEIPVKDLTLEQLHLLKVYHLAEAKEKNPRFFDEDLEDHQPFPTLQTVLQELDTHVGCNIEIKWNMQLKDGTFELNHPFDLNTYLDIILKVTLEYGGDRKIVFSSFNPDICIMIRLKQNKYPVVFLTQGVTAKYPTYHDPRCQTIPMAMKHAIAADILGINVHTEDILRDPSQVKIVRDAGLIIFCWGDDNNDKATIQHLKKLGLHAVIYDKIDEYNAKEVKESIFLVDARESQKALIALAHSNQTCGPPQPAMPDPITTEKEYYLDLEQSRNLMTTSTATSLASLSKNSVGGDSVFPMPTEKMVCHLQAQQQEMEIGDLAKNFSSCANNLGHTIPHVNSTAPKNSQPSSFPELCTDDESAKDCL
ncbi:glycerophosphocholine phosphodiesterase GPCPD1-like isoform X2 [Venturia canescens]|uniref:glycerophosphocholine phosphodiesterase GPCPD1-like isoform X2 n=1 Tax=Venturia canescens TaxID=32260 RepID=UPI001C9C9776|nr:glycerophosphocholine phosphodiesterase GPCPD1-like isoform X2 [Venturia canescens]